MLEARIIVSGDQQALEKIFSLEEKKFSNGRAEYKIILEKDKLIFEILAKDSIALRTVLNTITKIMSVHEKIENMIKND